jgi:integrase/recombinase XerD
MFTHLENEYGIKNYPAKIDLQDNLEHESTEKMERAPPEEMWYAPSEHQKMVNACETLRERLIVELLWQTGVRASELSGLKESHTKIHETKEDYEEDQIRVYTKKINTKNNWRWVFVSPGTRRRIDRYIETERKNYAPHEDSPYLLITERSDQMAEVTINKKFREIAERAGIQYVLWEDAAGRPRYKFHPHAARHSFAIHRVRAGMNLEFLRQLLGHESCDTSAWYLQFASKHLREAEHEYRPY